MRPRRHVPARATLGLTLIISSLVSLALFSACTRTVDAEITLSESINEIRRDAGLPPLRPDERLVSIARTRSEDMATNHYLGHVPPSGCDYVCLIDRQGIPRAYVGETIAANNFDWSRTTAITVDAWRRSPTHIAEILDCHYQRFGTGVAEAADGRIYFTTIYEGSAVC